MAEKANQKLQALLGLWQSQMRGTSIPKREVLPVSALKPWLGSLALFQLDPSAGPIFRLCGTGLHARFGGEMTGKLVSQLPAEAAEALQKELDAVISSRRPRRSRHISGDGHQSCTYHELYLPLADKDEKVELVLFASFREQGR